MSIFIKTTPIYVRLFSDRIEAVRLDTGVSITRAAIEKHSNSRLVLAYFDPAVNLLRSILHDLRPPKYKFYPPSFQLLMQQMEKMEGGLSQVEKIAMGNLGEVCGGIRVTVIEHSRPLSIDEAIELLNSIAK